ncbi:unnamed protein product [Moneuplotes crassus]|uniref:Uncharacterized protein n=2 Tax=Euplotes crassus TaxID=5936 RepID=A0AAD1U754_EUPCR|nr:unnamed protein product [Moneuplotes crassus]
MLSLKRKLNRLEPDESFFDFMVSTVPFELKCPHKVINEIYLQSYEETNKQILLTFADKSFKSDFLLDLVLQQLPIYKWSTFSDYLPDLLDNGIPSYAVTKENFEDSSISPQVILIDIMGEFSTEKFRQALTSHYMWIAKLVFSKYETGMTKELIDRKLAEDLPEFIHSCCENLYIIKVFSCLEFSMVIKSLPGFIRKKREVKLVLIDGLHHLKYSDPPYETARRYNRSTNPENFFESNAQMPKKNPMRKASGTFEKAIMDTCFEKLNNLRKKYNLQIVYIKAKGYSQTIKSSYMKRNMQTFLEALLKKNFTDEKSLEMELEPVRENRYGFKFDTNPITASNFKMNEIFFTTLEEKSLLETHDENQSTSKLVCFIKKTGEVVQAQTSTDSYKAKFLATFIYLERNPETDRLNVVDSHHKEFIS